MLLRLPLALALLAALPFAPGHATAQNLRFDEALERATSHPRVAEADARLGARASGDAALSRAGGNPTLTLMPGWRAAGDDERGAELQASLVQNLRLGGYGRARLEAARTEREALVRQVDAETLHARLEAARAWLDLRAAEERMARLDEDLALLTEWRASLTRAEELGAATRADAASLRAAEAEARELRARHAGALQTARAALAERVAAPADALLATAGPAPEPELPPNAALAREDVTALPAAELARAAREAAAARLDEADASGATQLGLGAQVQLDQPGGAGQSAAPHGFAAFAVVSVTLPAFERNQRARSRAAAELAGAAIAEARALWRACLAERAAADAALAALEEEVVPAHEAAAEAWARRRALGAATVFEELAARRALLAARQRALFALRDARWARARIALLRGALHRENAR